MLGSRIAPYPVPAALDQIPEQLFLLFDLSCQCTSLCYEMFAFALHLAFCDRTHTEFLDVFLACKIRGGQILDDQLVAVKHCLLVLAGREIMDTSNEFPCILGGTQPLVNRIRAEIDSFHLLAKSLFPFHPLATMAC